MVCVFALVDTDLMAFMCHHYNNTENLYLNQIRRAITKHEWRFADSEAGWIGFTQGLKYTLSIVWMTSYP